MTKKVSKFEPKRLATYNQFVKFMALTQKFRKDHFGYTTMKAFAKEHDITPKQLTNWKQKDRFKEDKDQILYEWGSSRTPEVIESFFKKLVKKPDAPGVKLWRDMFGSDKIKGGSDKQEKSTVNIIKNAIINVDKSKSDDRASNKDGEKGPSVVQREDIGEGQIVEQTERDTKSDKGS